MSRSASSGWQRRKKKPSRPAGSLPAYCRRLAGRTLPQSIDPWKSVLPIGLWGGPHSVPTPALSPGEREHGPPPRDHTRAGRLPNDHRLNTIQTHAVPSPWGEGQGEGKYSIDHAKCSISQGLLSTSPSAPRWPAPSCCARPERLSIPPPLFRQSQALRQCPARTRAATGGPTRIF